MKQQIVAVQRMQGHIAYRLPGEKVSLDTDAKSKCDKYIHLGMHLAGTRHFGPTASSTT